MYNTIEKKPIKGTLKLNKGYQGETIEHKVQRIMNNKEPITDGAPLIYTERKDGVQPAYDIRTDRWEIAIEAMDKVQQTYIAKRQERIKAREEAENPKPNEGQKGDQNPQNSGETPTV